MIRSGILADLYSFIETGGIVEPFAKLGPLSISEFSTATSSLIVALRLRRVSRPFSHSLTPPRVQTFALATDQLMTSTLISSPPLSVAVELLQIRSGFAINQPILRAPNVQVLGTPEALKAEFEESLGRVFGEEGKEMKKIAMDLGKRIREKREGEWRDAVVQFGRLGRKD